jgi:RNA polymerase sigma factor (sigma-70 family)
MSQGLAFDAPTLRAVDKNAHPAPSRPATPAPATPSAPVRASDGSSAAACVPPDLAAAYDRLGASLFRFFYARVSRDEHLAADLMQQLWAAAARNASRVPETEIEFWLRGVARNILNTHWRRVGARPPHVAMDDGMTGSSLAARMARERLPEDELGRRETQDQLLRAITRLSQSDQDLIFAHYFEGAQQVDLSRRLGISARAIEGRLYRARQLLREALKETE